MSRQPCHKNTVGPKNPRGPRPLSLPDTRRTLGQRFNRDFVFHCESHAKQSFKSKERNSTAFCGSRNISYWRWRTHFPINCPTSYVRMCESAKSCLILGVGQITLPVSRSHLIPLHFLSSQPKKDVKCYSCVSRLLMN